MKTALILAATVFSFSTAHAEEKVQLSNRVNLDDVNIQGEANKNGAQFLNRNRFGLDDRVKVRKDFRRELGENVPDSFGDLPKELLAE